MRSLSAALVTVAVAGLVLAGPPAGAGTSANAEPAAGVRAANTAADTPVASTYTSVQPSRVLDTRDGTGGVVGPVGAGGTLRLHLAGRVPATTTAVVLNLTGTQPTAATYVTAYPGGQNRPTASNLNLGVGETRANLVTVTVGADQSIALYNNAGSTHLIADLAGYYSTGTGAKFLPVDARRVLPSTHVGPRSTTVLDLTRSVPASATAVVLNVTAAWATQDTYVTAWPAGSPLPGTSTVNVPRGGVNPNLTTVAVGADRKVNLYNQNGEVDLIVDFAGFYTPEFGAVFTPVSPVRVFDTRDGTGTWDGAVGPLTARGTSSFNPGVHVPDTAIGMVINLTGITATAGTYLTAWQNTYTHGPSTSNLNLAAGQTASNLVVATTLYENPRSRSFIYNNAGDTHVAADLAGYFWVPQAPCTRGCGYAWGDNIGRLGVGTTTGLSLPAPLAGLSDVVDMSHGLAARADGTVWGWGGWGTFTGTEWDAFTVPVPARIPGLTGVTAVENGTWTGYALRNDGTVWAWGSDANGALGTGGVLGLNGMPVRVTGLTGVTAIAGGGGTTYALKSDGTVWAWGLNDQGQLGNGSTALQSSLPVQVSGLTGVTTIAQGASTAYAVTADGALWTWGSNYAGKLGTGSTEAMSRIPVRVSGLTGVTAVDGSYPNSYAVRQDGTVWSWGASAGGALGDGVDCASCVSAVPVRVVDVSGVVDVAATSMGAHVVDSAGRVWGWGTNANGELGRPVLLDRPYENRPVRISAPPGVTSLGDGGQALVANQ